MEHLHRAIGSREVLPIGHGAGHAICQWCVARTDRLQAIDHRLRVDAAANMRIEVGFAPVCLWHDDCLCAIHALVVLRENTCVLIWRI